MSRQQLLWKPELFHSQPSFHWREMLIQVTASLPPFCTLTARGTCFFPNSPVHRGSSPLPHPHTGQEAGGGGVSSGGGHQTMRWPVLATRDRDMQTGWDALLRPSPVGMRSPQIRAPHLEGRSLHLPSSPCPQLRGGCRGCPKESRQRGDVSPAPRALLTPSQVHANTSGSWLTQCWGSGYEQCKDF